MLVLEAAWRGKVGGVDGRGLLGLFERTVEWLRTLEAISPSLRRDVKILESARGRLEGELEGRY